MANIAVIYLVPKFSIIRRCIVVIDVIYWKNSEFEIYCGKNYLYIIFCYDI